MFLKASYFLRQIFNFFTEFLNSIKRIFSLTSLMSKSTLESTKRNVLKLVPESSECPRSPPPTYPLLLRGPKEHWLCVPRMPSQGADALHWIHPGSIPE